MTDLRFITRAPVTTENPVTKAIDDAENSAYKKTQRTQATRKSDQDYAKGQQEYDFAQADNPIKLRTAGAGATSAESNARLATGTEGSKIMEAGNKARESGFAADTAGATSRVATGTEGSKITEASNKARESGSAADESAAKATVAQGTTLSKITQAGADANKATAEAQGAGTKANKEAYDFSDEQRNAHFVKSLDILKNQGYDAAAQYAQQNGIPLPPDFLKDARMRQGVASIEARAKAIYSNQPAAYAKAVAEGIKNMKLHADDLGYNPAEEVYTNPGMPPPTANAYSPVRPAAPGSPNLAGLDPKDGALVRSIVTSHQIPNPDGSGFPPTVPDRDAIVQQLTNAGRADLAQRIYGQGVPGRTPFLQINPNGPGAQNPQPQPRPAAPVSQAPPPQAAQPGQQPQAPQQPASQAASAPQAQAMPMPPMPAPLQGVPRPQWSASRHQWRDANGVVYDATGNKVQ